MEPQIDKPRNLAAAAMRYTAAELFSAIVPGTPMYRLAVILVLAALAAPALAAETQQGAIVMRKWAQMDQCAKKAQEAFPDFTPESNAKRETTLRTCLQNQNLPLRVPLSPNP
jgi:hypothetical protein